MAAYDDNAPIQLLRLSLHLCEMDTAVDNTIGQEDESPIDFVVIDGEPKTSAWVVVFQDVSFFIVLPVQRPHRDFFAIHYFAAGAGKPTWSRG